MSLRAPGGAWWAVSCAVALGLFLASVFLSGIASSQPSPAGQLTVPAPPTAEVLAEQTVSADQPVDTAKPEPTSTPAPEVAEAQATPGAWYGPTNVNYLLLGLDRRGNEELARPDVIVVGNVDLEEKRASLLSIPRDMLVSIPGYGTDRINAAFAYGELDRETGGGPALLRTVVEQNLGIRIDHIAMLDFNCFRTIVDGLGGINVQVPERIVDPYYPTEDFGYRTVDFEPGFQQMSGERALEYARSRHTTSDFSRMHRQQQVVAAIRERLLTLNALPTVPRIVAGCGGMSTDLSILNIIGLANAARDIHGDRISMRVIESPMVVDAVTPAGAMVLQPRWELIRPLVQSVFPGSAMVAGTGRPETP